TVTNAGEAPLSSVTVTDSLGMTATYQADDDGDNTLEVGETWIFTATWTVAATPDPLLNTGTASGSAGTNTYTDTDDHSLDVLTSASNLLKTGPAIATVAAPPVTLLYAGTGCGSDATNTSTHTGDGSLYGLASAINIAKTGPSSVVL